MLSREQLLILKKQLLNDRKELEYHLHELKKDSLEEGNSREAVGELSIYDNHPADMGSELFEREKDMALDVHADSELVKIKDALKAMDAGTYGVCTVCGIEIPFERLEALPYSLNCKEHSPKQFLPSDRPVEEEVLEPAHGNYFQHRQFTELTDLEDSYQEVARYGTSETPSDLKGDYEDYNSLYNQGHDDEGFTEDYETFVGTDITGKNKIIFPSKKHEEYEALLNQENIDAPFGDVPYKQTDGYVDDKNEERTEE
ncbi:TraR/DksA C4-type zinc finger protein [Bacillus sp. 03113]|uniref:TraR/DksA C4-type zinc finger protein n=1 Tax=Bacillus sp. 03113 TaxID=2578211 RepID=UPI0011429AEF|nr:TraR/DksA C4-type zinc finger protein [Bacillus sp. 03113]